MLFADETELRLFPPLRAGWAPRGEPAAVPLTGGNARRVLFGAIHARTGRRLLLPRRHQRAADFQAFLRLVHAHYRGWHVVLLLDENPCHTAAGSRRLAGELGIELWWLPVRCPELNAMDHRWRHGKERVSANRQYRSIEEHVSRFVSYVESLNAADALRKAGLRSDSFWLR